MELTQLFKYSKLYQISSSSLHVHMEATCDKSKMHFHASQRHPFNVDYLIDEKKFLSGSHLLVNIFAMPVRNPSHTQVHYCVNCIVCTYVRRVTQDASCLLPTSVDLRKKKQTSKTFSPIRAVFLPFGYFKTGRNDDVTAERTGFILRSKPPHLRSMKTRNIFPLLKNKKKICYKNCTRS